jgi:hypothetical protein
MVMAGCGRGFFNTPPPSTDADAVTPDAPGPPITYVQGSLCMSSNELNGCAFPLPLHDGNSIVAIVWWDGMGRAVNNFVDDAHSQWSVAIGPQVSSSSGLSQMMFVTTDIAARSTDTVQAAFTDVTQSTVVIAEYSGVDPTQPVDAVAGNSGTSAMPPDSGPIDTLHAHDLLIGIAGTDGAFSAADPSFTPRASSSNLLTGDREVSATGTYDYALAVGDTNASWLVQVVALRGM